jgi:alkylmercury lyase
MYPPFLEMTVQVESPCYITGAPVQVRISTTGMEEVVPTEADASIVTPDGKLDVRQGFCNHFHFSALPRRRFGFSS